MSREPTEGTRVRGGAVRSLFVLVLLCCLAAPVQASELAETRDELARARGEVDELERAVQRTRDEVAAVDERLTTATTQLATVRDELADAERDLEAADERERATAREFAEADARLDEAVERRRANQQALESRAVAAYKHGGSLPSEVLVRGIAQAGDWHEIATTLETVDRLVTADRLLVDEAVTATHGAAELRGEVTTVRGEALTARREADRERRRVETLVARQERLVADIDEELDRRRAALDRLESDAAARAVLVRDLEQRVAELQFDGLRPVVTTVDLRDLGPPPDWAGRLPAAGRPWAAAIEAAAANHGLDGRLLAAVVWTESNFRPDAVSHAGAIGLAQLMPGTARGLGVDPRDPLDNLAGGAAYLRAQLSTFERVDLALAAYNAGPGRVRDGRIPNIVETQLYVVRVLERYEQIAGG